MLSDRLLSELNEQIRHEFYSANYYLAMAGYCLNKGLDGFANFFIVQADEERFHAMKFYNYINDIGGRLFISGYDDPKNDFTSLEDVFESALHHEQFVTKRINTLAQLADEEKHYPTISLLKWFIDEQVEEEATMSTILSKIRLVGNSGPGLLMMDQELSARVFTPPATTE